MNILVDAALGNAVTAAALAVAVFPLTRACRKPTLSHCLWVLVLLKLITPPVINFPVPERWVPRVRSERAESPAPWETERPAQSPNRTARVESLFESLSSPETESDSLPESSHLADASGDTPAPWEPADPGGGEQAPPREHDRLAAAVPIDATQVDAAVERAGPSAAGQTGARWGRIVVRGLLAVWLGGTLLAFVVTGLRIRRFQRALRLATPAPIALQEEVERLASRIGLTRPPGVWLVPGTVCPMLWAVIGRPRLLFPARLAGRLRPEARQTLCLHELAHLRRGDHWVRLLESVVTAVYWWHPVVWWTRREIQAAEEACCDRWVVSEMPGSRQCYAEALVEAVAFLSGSRRLPPLPASGLGTFLHMERRVRAIMLENRPKSLTGRGRLAVATLAVICLGLSPTLGQVEKTHPRAVEAAEGPLEAAPGAAATPKAPPQEPAAHVGQIDTAWPDDPTGFKSPPRPLAYERQVVWSVAFSPDGKHLATGGGKWEEAGVVRLWDAHSGRQLAVGAEKRGISSLAFSHDGTLLAVSSRETAVTIRRVPSFEVAVLIPVYQTVRVAFSPDGKTLATADQGPIPDDTAVREVRLWDVETGRQVLKCQGDLFRLFCVAFSPDGRLVAAGGGNNQTGPLGDAICWDAATGRPLVALKGHAAPIHSLAFSPDGKTLATGSEDNTARLWEVDSGKLKTTLEGHKKLVNGVAFSPDGKLLATAGSDRMVKLWNVADGALVADLAKLDKVVRSVAFSPKGDVLAVGGGDGIPRLWDVVRRREVGKLEPEAAQNDPPLPVLGVACSPDGKIVASCYEGNDVRLRDAETGDVVQVLRGHDDVVSCVTFSPDGKTLATASCDKTIKLWEVATGKPQKTLSGHTDLVLAVAFSPDGKTLASGGNDNTVRLWDARTGRQEAVLEGHEGLVRSVAFSPDGSLLASAAGDRTIRLWDVQTQEAKPTFTGSVSPLGTVAISLDGRLLATGGAGSPVNLWDLETLRLRGAFITSWGVPAMDFLPSSQAIAVGTHSGNVSLWDLQTFQEAARYEGYQGFTHWSVQWLAASPDGTVIATAGRDGLVKLWPATSGQDEENTTAALCRRLAAAARELRWDRHPAEPPEDLIYSADVQQRGAWFVAASPDGKTLAAGGDDKTIRLLDPTTGGTLKTLEGHRDVVNAGAFSPDGATLATAGFDKTVRLWDVASGNERFTFTGHPDRVRAVLFTPDGKTVISASGKQGLIKLWAAADGAQTATLEQDEGTIAMDLSPDAALLATANWDNKVRVWDLAERKQVAVLDAHPDSVRSVAFSPDGKTLASTSATPDPEQNVKLWDVGTWRQRAALVGHPGHVHCVRFSPDGRLIATASSDLTVRLWRAADGGQLEVLRRHAGPVVSVAFLPDGKALASTGLDGTVNVWNLQDPAPRSTADQIGKTPE